MYCLDTRGSFSNPTTAPDEWKRSRISSRGQHGKYLRFIVVEGRVTPMSLKTRQTEERLLAPIESSTANPTGITTVGRPDWKVVMASRVPKWKGVLYLGELVRAVRPSTTRRPTIDVIKQTDNEQVTDERVARTYADLRSHRAITTLHSLSFSTTPKIRPWRHVF